MLKLGLGLERRLSVESARAGLVVPALLGLSFTRFLSVEFDREPPKTHCG